MTSLKTLELGRSKVVFRAQLDDFSQCLGLFTSMRQMYFLNIHQHLFCSLAGPSVAINGLTCTHDLWRKCLATFIFMLLFFFGTSAVHTHCHSGPHVVHSLASRPWCRATATQVVRLQLRVLACSTGSCFVMLRDQRDIDHNRSETVSQQCFFGVAKQCLRVQHV